MISSSFIIWFRTKVSIKQQSSLGNSSSLACCLMSLKVFSSKVILPNVSCIWPFLQLITTLEVATNGLPRKIRMGFSSSLSYVSKIMKSIRQTNLSTCMSTSSTIPFGTFTDLSIRYSVTEVGFKTPRSNFWWSEKDSKLILTLRSRRAFLVQFWPIDTINWHNNYRES